MVGMNYNSLDKRKGGMNAGTDDQSFELKLFPNNRNSHVNQNDDQQLVLTNLDLPSRAAETSYMMQNSQSHNQSMDKRLQ